MRAQVAPQAATLFYPIRRNFRDVISAEASSWQTFTVQCAPEGHHMQVD